MAISWLSSSDAGAHRRVGRIAGRRIDGVYHLRKHTEDLQSCGSAAQAVQLSPRSSLLRASLRSCTSSATSGAQPATLCSSDDHSCLTESNTITSCGSDWQSDAHKL